MTTSLLKLAETARFFFFVECFSLFQQFEVVKYVTLICVFQELPEDVGEALCELIDGETDVDGMLKRYLFLASQKLNEFCQN